jgi:hypothetical protein
MWRGSVDEFKPVFAGREVLHAEGTDRIKTVAGGASMINGSDAGGRSEQPERECGADRLDVDGTLDRCAIADLARP